MDEPLGFALFPTSIGGVGIAWSREGIRGIFLPEATEAATRRRIARRFPAAQEAPPPEPVQRAIDAIAAHLRGERAPLRQIALDLSAVPALHRRIYEVARAIPPGRTLRYGEIAERLGNAQLARDVGEAMAKNPFSIVVPCHRVLAAGGKLGGFSAHGGARTKLRLLSIEGVQLPGTTPLFARLERGDSSDPTR
jgi:methylated-DNA-[protein]-cysteine S-methyltransferase